MRLPFGLQLTRTKAHVGPTDLSAIRNAGWMTVMESFAGAWQRGVVDTSNKNIFQFSPLFRCVTLIAGDVAKLGVRLVELADGIWQETTSPAFSPVLRKPNRYQTWIQFVESWMLSKLMTGNTYVLKVRDNRGIVVALYVLDPAHVTVMVAPGAAVFYKLRADNLSTIGEDVTVPADDIIHDRMNTLYHPLVGISPISAACLSGALGVEMQKQSAKFYKNGAMPGGILTAEGAISKETAERLKTEWQQNYGDGNTGKTAVLADGLKYEKVAMSGRDAQLAEVLKISGEMVCQSFGVPLSKVGIGQATASENVAADNQAYYANCLQKHIEDFEFAIDDGLSLPASYGVELNVKNLMRMDPKSQMETLAAGVNGKILAINEARKDMSLRGVPGGDQPWMQMQDFPIEMLLEMQRQQAESGKPPGVDASGNEDDETAPPTAEDEPPPDEDEEADDADAKSIADLLFRKALEHEFAA